IGDSPSFRSFRPNESSIRFFPRKFTLLSNFSEITEVLPTYDRNFHFALTARDNNPEAGIAVWDFVEFKADGESGPFQIKQPNFAEVYEAGSKIEVIWDVANTDNLPVNCK